jgi:AcrR family transcriptional regulator
MSPSLRERKKLKTRASIQKEAMRLFLENGYEATTIEEIAAAVEISPSTFFNYFPSKEEVVLEDELDPLILAAFDAQPPEVGPVAALRKAMRIVLTDLTPEQDAVLRQRIRLMSSEPELRATMLNQFAGLVDQIAELLATRVGRSPGDFALHNLAGALLGVMMAALLVAADKPAEDLVTLADQALAHLDAGLPLDWPPARGHPRPLA